MTIESDFSAFSGKKLLVVGGPGLLVPTLF